MLYSSFLEEVLNAFVQEFLVVIFILELKRFLDNLLDLVQVIIVLCTNYHIFKQSAQFYIAFDLLAVFSAREIRVEIVFNILQKVVECIGVSNLITLLQS